MQDHNISAVLETALSDAKAVGADAADLVHIASTDISVSQRLGKPEDMERAESSGIGIRVFVGKKYALASSTDLSREAIKEAAERAVVMAKASIEDEHSQLAEREQWGQYPESLDIYEADEPPIEWMREQCARTEDTARAKDGITNSEGAELASSHHAITLASSVGKMQSYQSSSVSLSVSVLAGEGDKMERDYSYSVARHIADLRAPETIGEEAAERAIKRINPRKQSTKEVPVIFEPRIGKSMLGYFAGAISGSAVARGTSFLKDKMGEAIFSDAITILDDPHRKRGLASKPFDAEGLANDKLALVEEGVLQTWLLDIRSANQLGLKSNARATRGMSGPPSPSATNLYMQPGEATPQDLLADIKDGLYVTEAFGMGVNLVTGDYSQGVSGFWIENGAITYPVSELTMAGHLLEMFKQLTPANDLQFDYSTNTPTFRLERMMVAGA